ncbi:MAG: conjugal transfer protein TraB [Desulfobulbaceae bacterium]|nr:conjugal transfer protein TraB [Desulfobulbaceae bacterium]
MRLRERFEQLTPAGRKTVIWSVLGVLLITLTVTGYHARSGRKQDQADSAGRDLRLEEDLMEKTIFREHRRKLEDLEGLVTTMQRELDRVAKEKAVAEKPPTDKEPLPQIPDADTVARAKEPFPPPVMPAEAMVVAPKERKKVGKITVVRNATQAKDLGGQKRRTVYLPPSFMEANLLTGFDAATSGSSKNSPEPLLLRIKTPAVLPNDVKAELSGCFVVAEAVGRLDKERADVRLVSLSCLSNEGRAVIDTPVKGFVTDSDSKVGLSGRVVSRMGAATVRAIVAGLFEGAGDAFKAAATTTSTSALGSTATIDSSQVGKSALGTGLSQGAQTMSDFYLDLVKQTTPVIEVGAAKKVTVIVSEGKDLEIRDIRSEGLARHQPGGKR